MNDSEKIEIINYALEAGPTNPFPNFLKLFKTWLEVLCIISEENRCDMFSNYFKQIVKKPQKIILFNLDGVCEIFLKLENSNQQILSKSIKSVFEELDGEGRRKVTLLTPQIARKIIGF